MEALTLKHTISALYSEDSDNLRQEIYSIILKCKEWYPNIIEWYLGRFFPGLNNNSRSILVCYVKNELSGVALLKKETDEKKICTFFIKSQFRKNGIGKAFFSNCLEILETDSPLISIPQERLSSFSSIIEHYNLKLEQVLNNYYRQNSCEYVFNGYLNSERPFINSSENNEMSLTNRNRELLVSSCVY